MKRLWSIPGSGVNEHDEELQAQATKEAVTYASKVALLTLAGSATAILGAAKLFPGFNSTLSVSSKTALIVTPAFGVYFLLAEFRMNERKRQHAADLRTARVQEIRERGY
eukprot:scaffold9.g3128.t1